MSEGTLRLLGPTEIAAVIEHERGHVHERHGLVMLPMLGLKNLFRWIPYARLAPREISTLLEMSADDYSARRFDPLTLAGALVDMAASGCAPGARFRPPARMCPEESAGCSRVHETPKGPHWHLDCWRVLLSPFRWPWPWLREPEVQEGSRVPNGIQAGPRGPASSTAGDGSPWSSEQGCVVHFVRSCRRVVQARYERPYGCPGTIVRIPEGAVPAHHGGAFLI